VEPLRDKGSGARRLRDAQAGDGPADHQPNLFGAFEDVVGWDGHSSSTFKRCTVGASGWTGFVVLVTLA
jgi:hypothetical protein